LSDRLPTLQQCLLDADPARLEVIARRWQVDELPPRRGDAAALLAARMQTPGLLEEVWETLSTDERQALTALRATAGIAWPTFTRRWGQVRAMGPGRLARERPWEAPVSPAESLWYWGLVFRVVVEGPQQFFEAACLPRELADCLPALPPAALTLPPTDEPPICRPADDTLLDDACTLLAHIHNHPLRPAWSPPDDATLTRRLRVPDPVRLAFLYHLVNRLGWLRSDRPDRLRLDPRTTEWLQADTPTQRSVLAGAWRDDPTWNDLWHVPGLQPEETGSWSNDPLQTRRALLGHFSRLLSTGWHRLADVVAAIKEHDPDFQRPDGDYSTWYIRDVASGAYLSGFDCWDAVEGALIRYLLSGPMAWLGLVELGFERQGAEAVAVRLSPAGAAFLGLAAAAETAPQRPTLTLRPDLTVLAPAALRHERFQLNRVADWVRSGDPYLYRLTPASLERARQQRISVEDVLRFLERATAAPVPPLVRTALLRWAERGAEVRLEQGILLHTSSAALLQELLAAPATRPLIGQVLGPQTALVPAAHWPRLARALVERGLLPDVHIEEKDED